MCYQTIFPTLNVLCYHVKQTPAILDKLTSLKVRKHCNLLCNWVNTLIQPWVWLSDSFTENFILCLLVLFLFLKKKWKKKKEKTQPRSLLPYFQSTYWPKNSGKKKKPEQPIRSHSFLGITGSNNQNCWRSSAVMSAQARLIVPSPSHIWVHESQNILSWKRSIGIIKAQLVARTTPRVLPWVVIGQQKKKTTLKNKEKKIIKW